MKTLIVIALSLISITGSIISQDSVLWLKDTDVSYSRLEKIKSLNSNDITTVNKISDFDDVTQITFLSNDNLKLMNKDRNEIILNIKDISEVTRKKGIFSPVLGGVLGGVGGLLTGAIIGNISADKEQQVKINWNNEPYIDLSGLEDDWVYTIRGGLIGLALGTISGILIANLINTDYLQLDKIPMNRKRDKLIRFLK